MDVGFLLHSGTYIIFCVLWFLGEMPVKKRSRECSLLKNEDRPPDVLVSGFYLWRTFM